MQKDLNSLNIVFLALLIPLDFLREVHQNSKYHKQSESAGEKCV